VTLYDDAVDVLTHWQAPTEEQELARAAYVTHLRVHPDGLWRSCFPDHLTAGALVLSHDRRHVLLNLHRKARRWFHFGGHLEDDATLAGAALREATEESGLDGLLVDAEPLHLSTHPVEFCDPRGTVRHLDVRFLARAGADVEPVISEESLDVRWWPLDDLPTDEPDMLDLVELALARSA
jgi:8-oxo-dGTP pyrophosphatase MutT (NUDIX family)